MVRVCGRSMRKPARAPCSSKRAARSFPSLPRTIATWSSSRRVAAGRHPGLCQSTGEKPRKSSTHSRALSVWTCRETAVESCFKLPTRRTASSLRCATSRIVPTGSTSIFRRTSDSVRHASRRTVTPSLTWTRAGRISGHSRFGRSAAADYAFHRSPEHQLHHDLCLVARRQAPGGRVGDDDQRYRVAEVLEEIAVVIAGWVTASMRLHRIPSPTRLVSRLAISDPSVSDCAPLVGGFDAVKKEDP